MSIYTHTYAYIHHAHTHIYIYTYIYNRFQHLNMYVYIYIYTVHDIRRRSPRRATRTSPRSRGLPGARWGLLESPGAFRGLLVDRKFQAPKIWNHVLHFLRIFGFFENLRKAPQNLRIDLKHRSESPQISAKLPREVRPKKALKIRA